MTKHAAARTALALLTLLAASSAPAGAQSRYGAPAPEDLARTIAALDAAVFDAFNRCDLETFGSHFSEDVEFYHDTGGVTLTRARLVESVKNNVCGKVRREIVAGSIEVWPVPGYGAVQTGTHRFYELSYGKPNEPSGIARFMHLWRNKDGVWRITRVVSYDHGPARRIASASVEFFDGLKALCGQRFAGVTDFTSTANDPFAGARLVMSVDSCADDEIRIGFAVGEDRSRTWILTRHGDRVLFKHDHRKPDGTPDEITMYGGWAAEGGTATRARFPADAETAKLIPAAATNVWTLEVDAAKRQFVYFLERDGKPRYRAVFDLSETQNRPR